MKNLKCVFILKKDREKFIRASHLIVISSLINFAIAILLINNIKRTTIQLKIINKNKLLDFYDSSVRLFYYVEKIYEKGKRDNERFLNQTNQNNNDFLIVFS